MDKKKLYESIMQNVAEEVKKVLNEGEDFSSIDAEEQLRDYLRSHGELSLHGEYEQEDEDGWYTLILNDAYLDNDIVYIDIDKEITYHEYHSTETEHDRVYLDDLDQDIQIDIMNQLKDAIAELSESARPRHNRNKSLNENAPFMQNGKYYIICDKNDRDEIQDIFDKIESKAWEYYENDTYLGYVEDEGPITLAGITGYVNGEVSYNISSHSYEDSDYPGHSWIETEIDDVELNDYSLTLYDEENGMEYEIYLEARDMPKRKAKDTIEDTDVRRKYIEQQKAEKEKRLAIEREKWEEERKKQEQKQKEYEAEVKANPEKYIKIAEDLVKSAADNYNSWWDASDAEEIYKILGMKKEAEIAHNIATTGYHREEAAAGLL